MHKDKIIIINKYIPVWEVYSDSLLDPENIIGVRIHGLIGDNIRFSYLIPDILKNNKRLFLLMTNTESGNIDKAIERMHLYRDIYSYLIDKKVIAGIYFTTIDSYPDMLTEHLNIFRHFGIQKIHNFSYPDFENIDGTTVKYPYLGFENLPMNPNKICLFRYSGFHTHFLLKHIPESKWIEIENILANSGYELYLYGYDDSMQTTIPPERDFRRKLSIIESIRHASDSKLYIGTTTFLPLYLSGLQRKCAVIADPRDVKNLTNHWRTNEYYIPIPSTENYIEIIKYIIKEAN